MLFLSLLPLIVPLLDGKAVSARALTNPDASFTVTVHNTTTGSPLQLPTPQTYRIPNTNARLNFLAFYHELDPKEGHEFLTAAYVNAMETTDKHSLDDPVEDGEWRFGQGPLRLEMTTLVKGSDSRTAAASSNLMLAMDYRDLRYALIGIAQVFPGHSVYGPLFQHYYTFLAEFGVKVETEYIPVAQVRLRRGRPPQS